MNLLLDTHALLWALGDVDELAAEARAAITDGANEVLVSAASVWEIAIKASLGKLEIPDGLEGQLTSARFRRLPVTTEHAMAVRDLPRHHRDPFDRLLVGQASVESLMLVTRDEAMSAYGVPTLAC